MSITLALAVIAPEAVSVVPVNVAVVGMETPDLVRHNARLAREFQQMNPGELAALRDRLWDGLRRAVPEVFSDVAWGEEQVLARTRENLRSLGWRWRELTLRADVDRPEDLAELEGIVAF